MMKETVAVLFGGQSSEHTVSCMSAVNVIKQIDEEKYELVLIGITQEGRWLLVDSIKELCEDTWRSSKKRAIISPDRTHRCLLIFGEDGSVEKKPVDVAFPVLHGLFGEDGTIQGLFELAGIPYVGCGVLSSAVAMDKLYTKVIVDALGIRQAEYGKQAFLSCVCKALQCRLFQGSQQGTGQGRPEKSVERRRGP